MFNTHTHADPDSVFIGNSANRLRKLDPTKTLMLRKKFESELVSRFKALRKVIIKSVDTNDCFGLKNPAPKVFAEISLEEIIEKQYVFEKDSKKIDLFMEWLKKNIEKGILEIGTMPQLGSAIEKQWTDLYIKTAYQKGITNARTNLSKAGYKVPGLNEPFYSLSATFQAPFHMDRVGVLYTRAFISLKGITDEMGKQISNTLAQGMMEGQHPSVIAKRLAGNVDSIGINRAKTLARTEIIRAHHVATIQEYENFGIENVTVLAEWQTAGFKVCPKCQQMAGRDNGHGKGVYTLDQIRGLIPLHPNCVSGDSVIMPPDMTHIMKSSYTGPIVKVALSNGTVLTITPNHMLMTPHGFIMARFLSNADYLFYSPAFERIIFSNPNYNRDNFRIDQIVKAFSESDGVSSKSMEASSEYLHGDAVFCEKNIDIIRTTSFLENGLNSKLVKYFVDFNFSNRGVIDVFSGFCDFTTMLKRLLIPTQSFVGLSREFLAFFNGCLFHSKEHGLTSIPGSDLVFFQNTDYYISSKIEFFRNLFNRIPIVKMGDNYFGVSVDAVVDYIRSQWETSIDKPLFDSFSFFHANESGNFAERFPGHVQLVNVIDVSVLHVDSFPVFDVSTIGTMYNVNGILSSNCRCATLPVDVTDGPVPQTVPKAIKKK